MRSKKNVKDLVHTTRPEQRTFVFIDREILFDNYFFFLIVTYPNYTQDQKENIYVTPFHKR